MRTRFTESTKIQIRALMREIGLAFEEPRNTDEQWRLRKLGNTIDNAGMRGEWALARAIRLALRE